MAFPNTRRNGSDLSIQMLREAAMSAKDEESGESKRDSDDNGKKMLDSASIQSEILSECSFSKNLFQ